MDWKDIKVKDEKDSKTFRSHPHRDRSRSPSRHRDYNSPSGRHRARDRSSSGHHRKRDRSSPSGRHRKRDRSSPSGSGRHRKRDRSSPSGSGRHRKRDRNSPSDRHRKRDHRSSSSSPDDCYSRRSPDYLDRCIRSPPDSSTRSTRDRCSRSPRPAAPGPSLEVTVVNDFYQEEKRKKPPAPTRMSQLHIKISPSDFAKSMRDVWNKFYQNSDEIPRETVKSWYKRFREGLGGVRSKFSNVFFLIDQDNRSYPEDRMLYTKNHWYSHLYPAQLTSLINRHRYLVKDNPHCWMTSHIAHNMSTDDIMKSQTSPLQFSLSPDASNLPRPYAWSPVNSTFPYPIFAYFVKKNSINLGIKNRPDEIGVKIRYVEFLADIDLPNNNFLCGVLTAFGPNLFVYPLRVIQVLMARELIDDESLLLNYVKHPRKRKKYRFINDDFNTNMQPSADEMTQLPP